MEVLKVLKVWKVLEVEKMLEVLEVWEVWEVLKVGKVEAMVILQGVHLEKVPGEAPKEEETARSFEATEERRKE